MVLKKCLKCEGLGWYVGYNLTHMRHPKAEEEPVQTQCNECGGEGWIETDETLNKMEIKNEDTLL